MKNLKTIPILERPRERFVKLGKEALDTYELVAILIQTGSSDHTVTELAKILVKKFKSIRSLRKASIYDLMQIPGIGPAKAIQLLSALELGKRLQKEMFKDAIFLGSPSHVFNYLKDDLEMLDQEHFIVLYLNTKGYLIDSVELFIGSLNASIIHQRDIFKHAVLLSAAHFIMVHNHPSGDPSPSLNDKKVTDVIKKSSLIMDITLADHIIIGKNQYYSFKEHHMI